MALFTGYDGWLEGIRDWLDVDEFTDTQIATFLYLAHLRLNKSLESEFMQESVTIPVATGGIPIPILPLVEDFNKVRLVGFPGEKPMEALLIHEIITKIGEEKRTDPRVAHEPGWYCLDSMELYIYPWAVTDSLIDFYYYKKIPQLTEEEPSNVFTEHHEEALLYATCVEATPYMDEDERASTWATMLVDIIESINSDAKKATHGSSPIRRRIQGLS